MKILIADDNAEFRTNMKDIIELKGHQVFTAANGEEAVKATRAKHPDLIIMDIRMPVMDGVAAYEKIKETTPKTPVILVTAFASDDIIEGALRNGAFSCLKKPINFDELFEIVDNAMAEGRLVMVVDDNKEFSANTSDVLQAKGFRTAIAHDGQEAILKAQENKFDIILLDINLPYLNGLEAYRQIRKIRPGVVVIVITGYGETAISMAKQAVEQNAYTWIAKPVDFDKLLSLLERVNKQRASGNLEKPGNNSHIR